MTKENQEAKAYLMQYRDAAKRVDAIRMHLDDLRAMAVKITPNYGGEAGVVSVCSDNLGAAIAKIVDAENRLNHEVQELIDKQDEIERVIKSIPEPYSTLLYERYINGKTWEQIAVCMNYGYRQTLRLHGQALLRMQNVIECHTAPVI